MKLPSLADPETLGEDLHANLKDAVAVARRYCRDCADYHVVHAAVRIAGKRPAVGIDRDVIVEIIRGLLVDKPDADVVIAGSADSALLATAARAARLAAPAGLARSRFTVIDRCGTPLEFCRRFGERHGLSMTTLVAEISERPTGVPADVILVHSLLRFLPLEGHAGVLSSLGQSLKPNGRVVFSQGIGVAGVAGPLVDRKRLLDMAASGAIILPEPVPDFLARLARQETSARTPRADYASEHDLADLFRRSGLRVVDQRLVSRPEAPQRRRLVAVLAADQ